MIARITYVFLLLLLFSGCRKLTEVAAPDDKIQAAEIYKHNNTATKALKTIYALMADGNASTWFTALLTGLGGDELRIVSNSDLQEFYSNRINPSNVYSGSLWTAAYSYIYMANAVYEGCGNSTSLDPAIKKQLMAEALFIRAYWYFSLTNFYGDIPLPTTTNYKLNASLPRIKKDSVYIQVVADLIAARKDLEENYVGPDSKPGSDERVRPNKATATALLARLYLYMGRYSDAEQQASSLINARSSYGLVPLEDVFKKNSKEAIWQLMASTPNLYSINTHEGAEFIVQYPPTMTGQSVLRNEFVQAFESGDLRKSSWTGVYSDTTVTPAVAYYYPHKYKIKSGLDLQEYTMVFRLAEQHLIRAEARAHLNRLSDAVADINIIRKRAGLSSYTLGSQANVMKAIMKERQMELFAEAGHRWFDLKRTGNINVVMNAVCPLKSTTWKPAMQLWPIPSNDLSLNPKLKQNEGYY